MPDIHFGRAEPKIAFIRDRFQKAVDLTLEKVAGHLRSPAQYPLSSDRKSLEYAVHDLLASVSQHRRNKFIDKHGAHLSDSTAKRKQTYGDLAGVNLHAASAVTELVTVLPVSNDRQLTKEDAAAVVSAVRALAVKRPEAGDVSVKFGAKPALKAPRAVPRAAAVPTKLTFFVDSLTCQKVSEIRKDEISIGGFAADSVGGQLSKAVFAVGDFKKGDSLPLGANATFFDLPISADPAVGFPQVFSASLFLLEKDLIHNTELSRKLQIVCVALGALFIAIGATILVLGLLGVPFVTVPMMLAAFSIGLGFQILGSHVLPLLTDDFSCVGTDTLILDAAPNNQDAFPRSISLVLGNAPNDLTLGRYTAAVRWVAKL